MSVASSLLESTTSATSATASLAAEARRGVVPARGDQRGDTSEASGRGRSTWQRWDAPSRLAAPAHRPERASERALSTQPVSPCNSHRRFEVWRRPLPRGARDVRVVFASSSSSRRTSTLRASRRSSTASCAPWLDFKRRSEPKQAGAYALLMALPEPDFRLALETPPAWGGRTARAARRCHAPPSPIRVRTAGARARAHRTAAQPARALSAARHPARVPRRSVAARAAAPRRKRARHQHPAIRSRLVQGRRAGVGGRRAHSRVKAGVVWCPGCRPLIGHFIGRVLRDTRHRLHRERRPYARGVPARGSTTVTVPVASLARRPAHPARVSRRRGGARGRRGRPRRQGRP